MLEQKYRIEMVSVDLLTPGNYSIRKKATGEKQAGFLRSIKEHGVLTEPWVCDIDNNEQKEVIAGNRRVDAAREVGIKEVRCKIYPSSLPETSRRIMSLTENFQRKDLDSIDMAQSVFQLYELLGRDLDLVAQQISTTQQMVKDWIDSIEVFKLADDATDKDVSVAALIKRKISPARWEEAWNAVRHLRRPEARSVIREMSRNSEVNPDEIVDRVRSGKPVGTSIIVAVEDGDLHDAIKKAAIDEHKTKAGYLLHLARLDCKRRKYYPPPNPQEEDEEVIAQ